MENNQFDPLPLEIQIKILKYLDFDSLHAMKQTCHQFCNIINDFDIFAFKKFEKLEICPEEYYDVKPKSFEIGDLHLSNQLLEKWKSSIGREIPLYINYSKEPLNEQIVIGVFKESVFNESEEDDEDNDEPSFVIKLPFYPKSIDDFKFIRFWLLKFARCSFDFIQFAHYVFNPEMIKLIFDQVEIKKFKLFGEVVQFFYQNKDWFKFAYDYMVINVDHVYLLMDEKNNFDILLNIVLNEGDKIKRISLNPCNTTTTLRDLLFKHLKTSTNCSNVIGCIEWSFEKFVDSEDETTKHEKKYKITNIHNSNLKFSILQSFYGEENIYVKIRRLDVLTLNKQIKETSSDKAETGSSCSYSSTTSTGLSDQLSSNANTSENSVMPASSVPEHLIVQLKEKFSDTFRDVFVRELQQANLNVNKAFDNLLSQLDDKIFDLDDKN